MSFHEPLKSSSSLDMRCLVCRLLNMSFQETLKWIPGILLEPSTYVSRTLKLSFRQTFKMSFRNPQHVIQGPFRLSFGQSSGTP